MATFAVAEHGQWLATRAHAQHLRDLVEEQLAELSDGEQLRLDFDGVEAVTGAFADELVAALVAEHGLRVTAVNSNPDVTETIDLALSRRMQ